MQKIMEPLSNVTGKPAPAGAASDKREWRLPAELRDLVDGDPSVVAELTGIYLRDSAARLEVLKNACRTGDFKTIRLQAHSVKGSSLQIGAEALAQLCATLELCDKPSAEQRGQLIRSIEEEFDHIGRSMTAAVAA
jgi:HPt (histidine-containing phosphotransfer) domain-containing protein